MTKRIILFLGLLLAVFIVFYFFNRGWFIKSSKVTSADEEVIDMEKVSIKTEDAVLIVGNYYKSDTNKAILCLHKMPATKESWQDFATKARLSFNVLVIDLRGHGESREMNNQKIDYQKFSDQEHQDSIKDVEASVKFLESKNLEVVGIVGASIGANLALWYQSENPNIRKTVLLSPGFDYRSIETKPLATKLEENQGVFYIGGTKDVVGPNLSAADVSQTLFDNTLVKDKRLEIIDSQEHGDSLFKVAPNLIDKIIGWLNE